MEEAKNKVLLHLQKIQKELFCIERFIDLLRKAIEDKSNPLKVAQTRLEARGHRSGLELVKYVQKQSFCYNFLNVIIAIYRDSAQLRLITEVGDLQDCIAKLHYKLQETEVQHQQLLKTRSNLESDLKNKVNALFIDREKCMGLRRSYPVNNLIKY